MHYAVNAPRNVAQWPWRGENDQWLALSERLAVAAERIERDPDAAALLLDGYLYAMLRAWYEEHGWPVPANDKLLDDLDQQAPDLARRVRLALRAPDVAARLGHCRQLLALLRQARAGDEMAWQSNQSVRVAARSEYSVGSSQSEGWQAKGV
jgi:hypothetical protein